MASFDFSPLDKSIKETEEWLAQGKQIRNLSGWVYRKIKRIARWYRKNGWSTW